MSGVRTASFLALAIIVTACGPDDSSTPGSGGTSAAGSGGSGAGSGGSGGTSGAAGSGGPIEVFNPNLPRPSYDCRTDVTTRNCVSVSGTYDGQPIDRHCAKTQSPLALTEPAAWPAFCDVAPTFDEASVPIQAPGVFDHVVVPNQIDTGADVWIGLDNLLIHYASDHFTRAEVAGLVEENGATSYDTVSGTFNAKWDTAAANCSRCPPADIHGTFRVIYELQYPNEP